MATVTGLTAERMQEIIDDTVVGAHISGDNLILELHDGGIINAGNVRGPAGPVTPVVCTSTTRPASPVNGTTIFETDTFKTLIYYTAKTGWFPPWNTAWGMLGKHRLTTGSGTHTVSGYTDMIINNISFRTDRQYQIGYDGEADIDNAGIWLGEIHVNNSQIGRAFQINAPAAHGDYFSGSVLYVPGANGTWSVRLYASEYSGTAVFDMPASGPVPRTLWIRDVGPV